jgi:predicted AlkP superfamily phosphohydrolase/phosphomutase
MRFLRMLTNSLLAGGLGAAYLTVLVLQLNPAVPLVSASTWRWFATLGLLYGVHLAVMFYVLMVAREFFALSGMSPGWVSVRVLAWLAAAAAAIAATLMWLNVHGLAATLDESAIRRMTTGAAATTVSALVLLGIAIAHYSFGRRGSKVGATLFTIAAFGSLALPLAARGLGAPEPAVPRSSNTGTRPTTPGPRVIMLLLDGASFEYILPRVAEGRLPNFARLLEAGASLDLATIRPTQPDPVWASVATGMYPSKNGVRSAVSYYARNDTRPIDLLPDHCFSHVLVNLGFVREEPNSSSSWRARPLWSILASAGIPVGIVRWPLTYPVQPIQGFVVSDRFHELLGSMSEFDDRAAYPPDVLAVARAAFTEEGPVPVGRPTSPATDDRDRFYSRAMRDLRAQRPVDVAALRYQALDSVGHRYFRYVQPRSFGDVPDEQRRRYTEAIDHAYAYIDGEVGAALESLAPGDLLLVVSGFGMQPLNPFKQTIGRLLGGPNLTGTHERAPDGFLLAYGTTVERGRRPRGSIVDVAPTLLYFLGLPVARDMDGYARADLFTRSFTAERPIAFIPSYE